MSRKHNVLPNVLPDGAMEPINDMDLIINKLKYNARINEANVQRIEIGNKSNPYS